MTSQPDTPPGQPPRRDGLRPNSPKAPRADGPDLILDIKGADLSGFQHWTQQANRIEQAAVGVPLRDLVEALCRRRPLTLQVVSLQGACQVAEVASLMRDMPSGLTVETLDRRFEAGKPLHQAMLRLSVAMLSG